VHLCILPARSRKSAEKYRLIWTDEGSPFLVAHERLATALQAAFDEAAIPGEAFGMAGSQEDGSRSAAQRHKGSSPSGRRLFEVKVACGMSYGEPGIRTALRTLRDAGCDKVLVLPLYPQSAHSTTGAVHDAVERSLRKLGWEAPFHLIDNYHDNPSYIRALAASLAHKGFGEQAGDRVLFSYHSIPLKDIEAGDKYELQCDASSLQIASELGIERKLWTIAYQCRFDKGRTWLGPFVDSVLERWAEAGVGRVFMVCPGFSVDCLETLYDVEYDVRPAYEQACALRGSPLAEGGFVYVPCLGRTKAHVKVLYDVLMPFIEQFGATP
jgi:ferrochelatase